jgi:hypothetical protein
MATKLSSTTFGSLWLARLNTFSKAIQLNISIGNNITPTERAELLAQQRRMDDEVRLASPANTACAVRSPLVSLMQTHLNVLPGLQCTTA